MSWRVDVEGGEGSETRAPSIIPTFATQGGSKNQKPKSASASASGRLDRKDRLDRLDTSSSE